MEAGNWHAPASVVLYPPQVYPQISSSQKSQQPSILPYSIIDSSYPNTYHPLHIMSSDYAIEGSVNSDMSLDSLPAVMKAFKKASEPDFLPNIRFGHLTVPAGLSTKDATNYRIISAIRQEEIDYPIIFILSRHSQRICSMATLEDLPVLPKNDEKTLEYSWFSSILEQNRAGDGSGNWNMSSMRMNGNST
jgi:hypothetical protein